MHKVVICSLMLCLGLPGVVTAQDDHLAAGLAALDAGRDGEARDPLRRAAAEALFYLAVASRGEERRAYLDRAWELLPEEAQLPRLEIQAYRYLEEGKIDEAVATVEELLAAAPQDSKRAHKLHGDLLVRKGDRKQALASYRKALEIDGDYIVARLALGDVQRQEGDFLAAMESYSAVLHQHPEHAQALLGRAAARLFGGDAEGAREDLERAATVAAPGFQRHNALMGYLYTHAYTRTLPTGADRIEQAIEMWKAQGPLWMAAATCNAAGRVFLETGQVEEGKGWYERGWKIIEGADMPAKDKIIWKVRYLHALSRIAARGGDFDRAWGFAEEARKLMDSDPDQADHYAWVYPYLLGYIHLEQGEYDRALEEYQKSNTDRPFIQLEIARAYAAKGDLEKARLWFGKVLESATGLGTEEVISRPLAQEWLSQERASR